MRLLLLTLLAWLRTTVAFIPTDLAKTGAIIIGTGIGLDENWNMQVESAAGSKTHKDITREAVLTAAEKLLRDAGLLDGAVVSPLTAAALVSAAYGDTTSSKRFTSVIKALEDANAEVDSDLSAVTAAHFDAENFIGGNDRLLELRKDVIDAILEEKYEKARSSAGGLLHTLQDFYSHSNWVELGNRMPYDRLGVPGKQPTSIAPPSLPTCVNCDRANALFAGRCPSTVRNILLGRVLGPFLTSGYYSDQDRAKPDSATLARIPGFNANQVGKCSHGGILDGTNDQVATGGINKDSTSPFFSPHFDLHAAAADVAVKATRAFLDDVRAQVDDNLFLRFLGLDNGASLSFCIDTTGSMGDDIAQVKEQALIIIEGSLAGDRPPLDYVYVPFNDPSFGPSFVTDDPDEFKNTINAIRVSGGGDLPELAISGLILALQASRPGSTIFLFTDASAKDFDRFPEASALILDRKIRFFVIFTGSASGRRRRRETVTNSNALTLLAEQSGGQVLSGSKSDVGTLLSLTSTFIETSDITIYSRVEAAATDFDDGFNVTVPVDRTVTEIVITVSGVNPRVRIFRSSGNRVLLNSSDVAELPSSAVVRFPDPDADVYAIQTFSAAGYTLRIKGSSTFDFEHSLVVGEVSSHAGAFAIKGRPRVGDRLFLRVTTSGLESGYNVTKALVLGEDANELTSLDLIAVTDEQFVGATPLVVPSQNFLVAIEGTTNDVDGGRFRRLDPNLETPVQFGVTVLRESTLSLVQGRRSNVTFRVLNGGLRDTLRFELNDEREFVAFAVEFALDANESETVVVPFDVPSCLTTGGVNEVAVTVTSLITDEFNSFFINLQVVSESIDFTPPICFVEVLQPCPNDTAAATCSDSTWMVRASAIDFNSGLHAIANSSDTIDFMASSFASGLTNDFVSFSAIVSCCDDDVDVLLTDRAGNSGSCNVKEDLVLPERICAPLCQNGGRCIGPNTCFCLAGFHGDHCELSGCPPPPVPVNGFLQSNRTSYSLGSTATYECNENFALVGEPQRTCCAFGWTGTVPECVSKDVEIVLPEGYVFRTDSYIQLSRSLSFYRNTFSITFRPVLPDGLLFFSSQAQSGRGDFIAITLTNGYVSLHFTLGRGRLLLTHDERLTMESVHTVTVSHNLQRGTLIVDEGVPLTGVASGTHRALNYLRPALLHIGGVPSTINLLPEGISRTSLRGCVTRFAINNDDVDLGAVGVVRHDASRGRCDDSCAGVVCRNDGVCVANSDAFDFACNCSRLFTGKLCDVAANSCEGFVCHHGGVCSFDGIEARCTCPGHTTGRHCETILDWVPRRFSSAAPSYLQFPPPTQWTFRTDITLRFRPLDGGDGLLLYSGSTTTGDFLSVGVKDGFVEFRYALGSGMAVIRSTERISGDQIHVVTVGRNRRQGSLTVDGTDPVGVSPPSFSALNIGRNPLFVGGVPDSRQEEVFRNTGLTKSLATCLFEVTTMDEELDLRNPILSVNVDYCTDRCSTVDCLNGGTCRSDACECPPGFTGLRCEEATCSFNFAYCLNGGKCTMTSADTPECECASGFVGKTCDQREGTCMANMCQNEGRCIETPGSPPTRRCVCSAGFVGEFCENPVRETLAARFHGASFMELPRLETFPVSGRTRFTITFATIQDNGLLLYLPPSQTDFFSLAISNGRVEFRTYLGSGLLAMTSSTEVNDGKVHSVRVQRNRLAVSMIVDSETISRTVPGAAVGLNSKRNVFLGGIPIGSNATLAYRNEFEGRYTTGLVGCIFELSFDKVGAVRPLGSSLIVASSDVTRCN